MIQLKKLQQNFNICSKFCSFKKVVSKLCYWSLFKKLFMAPGPQEQFSWLVVHQIHKYYGRYPEELLLNSWIEIILFDTYWLLYWYREVKVTRWVGDTNLMQQIRRATRTTRGRRMRRRRGSDRIGCASGKTRLNSSTVAHWPCNRAGKTEWNNWSIISISIVLSNNSFY